MSGDAQREGESLGSCPGCGHDLPGSALVIRYETAEGEVREFARCGRCDGVVHPA